MLFALVFTITAMAPEAEAQCPPEPDWFAFPFQPGPAVSWTDPCGCTITVEYCWRTIFSGGVPILFDFAITNITANCPLGVNPCSTPEEIREQALRVVIGTVNPWGAVIPCCPQVDSRWRLFTAACITNWWYDGVLDQHRRDDCGDELQCWARMDICFTCDGIEPGDRGSLVINETIMNAGGNCPATWTTPYSTQVPCNGACQ